jgi:hypothetical protein
MRRRKPAQGHGFREWMRHPAIAAFVVWSALAGRESQQVPIRHLAEMDATSAAEMERAVSVWALSDGRVVVTPFFEGKSLRTNESGGFEIGDWAMGKVLLLSADLKDAAVFADSGSLAAGTQRSPVTLPYLADSVLLGDPNARVFLVISPSGKVARTMAPPGDLWITGSATSAPTVDARGRLVYRGIFPMGAFTMVNGRSMPPAVPDSFPLIRVDFDTRKMDTLAVVRMPTGRRSVWVPAAAGSPNRMRSIVQPLPTIDDWAVLSDGTIAIVRGSEYRVDVIRPDGATVAGPRLPFDWRRIPDSEKQRLSDSIRVFLIGYDSVAKAAGLIPRTMDSEVVPVAEIPDNYPSLRPRSVRADRDNNLWILPATSSAAKGGLLYDVVNAGGVLRERVQVPAGCSVAGFAPKSVVYLNCLGSDGAFRLKRTRVLR